MAFKGIIIYSDENEHQIATIYSTILIIIMIYLFIHIDFVDIHMAHVLVEFLVDILVLDMKYFFKCIFRCGYIYSIIVQKFVRIDMTRLDGSMLEKQPLIIRVHQINLILFVNKYQL